MAKQEWPREYGDDDQQTQENNRHRVGFNGASFPDTPQVQSDKEDHNGHPSRASSVDAWYFPAPSASDRGGKHKKYKRGVSTTFSGPSWSMTPRILRKAYLLLVPWRLRYSGTHTKNFNFQL